MIRGDLNRPFDVLELETVDSTNAEAHRRVAAGEAGPLWITARRQTEGRGRRGRVWRSDPLDLKATLLIGLEAQPADAAFLSFIAGLAAADLAAAVLPGLTVRLKWPNDVMVGDAKIAGVLIETARAAQGGLWAAIGVGVNLVSAPEGLDRPAVSVSAALGGGAPPTPALALERLDAALRRHLTTWAAEGRGALIKAWTERAYGLPGPCVARLPSGDVEGEAEGLEPDGALRLRLADGAVRLISAGEVFFGVGGGGG